MEPTWNRSLNRESSATHDGERAGVKAPLDMVMAAQPTPVESWRKYKYNLVLFEINALFFVLVLVLVYTLINQNAHHSIHRFQHISE